MAEGMHQLGKYRIVEELGSGGFATVFKAIDTTLDREVALKILHPPLLADRRFVHNFRQEAKTLAALRHPHIITIYEVGESDGRIFIAMELARGISLARAITRRQRIPWQETLALLKPVCEALDYAHEQNIVHRDLKPANILIDMQRGALLTDFGFAKLMAENSVSMSMSGGIVGTPGYIAPEVWENNAADAPVDIYALGCIVYEMLTGDLLFKGQTPIQAMRAHDRGPQFPATWPEDTPAGIADVLRTTLAREPAERYPSAGALWQALNDLEAAQAARAAAEQAEAARREAARRAEEEQHEADQRTAVAAQWRAEAEQALKENNLTAAKMAIGRWRAVAPDDPAISEMQARLEQLTAQLAAPEQVVEDVLEPKPAAAQAAPVVSEKPAPAVPDTEQARGAPTPPRRINIKVAAGVGGLIVVAVVLALLFSSGLLRLNTAASLPTDEPNTSSEPEATAPAAETSVPIATSAIAELESKAPTISQELADAFAGKYSGSKVVIVGLPDNLEEAVKGFSDKTGITIQYEGVHDFEASIQTRVNDGNPPDIADFSQPGLAANFAAAGKVIDVSGYINPEWLKRNYPQSLLDIATMSGSNGTLMAGVWYRVYPKSLVWYPKAAFDAAGYKVPTSWDELKALMEQIVADGGTPWCIGMDEAGEVTGWPATDWIEDMLLRTTSLENYDKWVRGELPFTDPIIKNAVKQWSDILFDDKYVYGGRNSIVLTNFAVVPRYMFEQPTPKCWLYKQGNFVTSFFPPDAKPGIDYDVFYLPPIDPQYGKPMLSGGDMMVAFADRPEVRAVMSFFSSGASVEQFVKTGKATSPHNDSSLDWYTNDVDRSVVDLLRNAESVRFDGSDLMPVAVGTGTFSTGMRDYIIGTVDLDQAMEEIQAGWADAKK
jgi:alpha-glucoside transport system substrate-binding protein